VILFDSQASSDLLSPAMYGTFVLPVVRDLIDDFRRQGLRNIPLIIGGNTTPMIDRLIETGANNLMCDDPADWPTWLSACRAARRAVRRNLNPAFIYTSDPDTIYRTARRTISEAGGFEGFIMGTSVIPFGTPTEKLLAVKQACLDAARPVNSS